MANCSDMIRDAIAENDFNILPPSLVTSTKTKQKERKKQFFDVKYVFIIAHTVQGNQAKSFKIQL